jgi:hypothetical protein
LGLLRRISVPVRELLQPVGDESGQPSGNSLRTRILNPARSIIATGQSDVDSFITKKLLLHSQFDFCEVAARLPNITDRPELKSLRGRATAALPNRPYSRYDGILAAPFWCCRSDAGESKPERPDMVPDTLNLVIWLIAGIAGGNAAGDLLKGDYDLGPGNTIAGGIGGVIGAAILQAVIPGLSGLDVGPMVGQVIAAAASGAALTVVAAVMRSRRMF